MAEFLSAAWFAAVDGTEVGTDPHLAVELDQIVTGAPDGDCRYRASLRHGRLHVTPGPGEGPPDLTLRLTYATAVGLATGTRTAHQAFQDGDIHLAGDLRLMPALTAALAALAEGLAPVRDRTRYPAAG